MKIYTNLRSVPQFANLSKVEMRKKFRHYYLKSLERWYHWLVLFALSFSFVTLEWFIREGFQLFRLSPLSAWPILLLRIGLYLIIVFVYKIFLNGIIASYAQKDVTTMPRIDSPP